MEVKLDHCGEIVVVTINGRLDIDKTKPFQEACLKTLLDKKVVFNLQAMNFVGSTGIQNFFQVLKEIQTKNKYGLKIAGMTADFLRVWALNQDPAMIVYENTQVAMKSFEAPPQIFIEDQAPSSTAVVQASGETSSGTLIS
jgi:anti-anti-sigma factor